jgi:2C-methyl-D-erythritol 2,4-cyclodiphosphate synthase
MLRRDNDVAGDWMHSALCGPITDIPIATIVTFGADPSNGDVWMLAIHDALLS